MSRQASVERESNRFFNLPKAPTYYPTEKEFADPLKYIQQIRPEAQRFGICKIVPPKSFTPPFCLDFKQVIEVLTYSFSSEQDSKN
jgi:hypothetical protein